MLEALCVSYQLLFVQMNDSAYFEPSTVSNIKGAIVNETDTIIAFKLLPVPSHPPPIPRLITAA